MTRYTFRFPHESLRAYQAAREFLRCVRKMDWRRGEGELKAQLNRAALSVMLNIAEGRSQKLAGNSGANFYRIALGSAAECHAALQAREILRDMPAEAETQLLRGVAGPLSGLIRVE